MDKQQDTFNHVADMAYVYAKMDSMRQFKAFDLDGHFAGNLIYASLLNDNEENRHKLQDLANENSSAGWQFQLRKPSGHILYQTDLTVWKKIFISKYGGNVQ